MKTLFMKNTDSQAAVRSPGDRGRSLAQIHPSTPPMAKRMNTATTDTTSSRPEKRGSIPTTEAKMVATMNTLATRKLAFWPNDSSTHLPLAARKPTSISRTSMTIFSSTTNPAMFLSLLVVALQAGPTLPSAGDPVGTGVQGPRRWGRGYVPFG